MTITGVFSPGICGFRRPLLGQRGECADLRFEQKRKKAHIVRAALESIAYQVKDLIDAMTEKSHIKLLELRVDGGPTQNRFLMQFQSNMLNASINKAEIEEASALGVALMAGLATGIWKNLDEVKSLREGASTFIPNMPETERVKLFKGWKNAIQRTLLKNNN
jgi:glycerol kinase